MRPTLLLLSCTLLIPTACAQTPVPFACPATLTVMEQAMPSAGWSAEAAKNAHSFQTAKIYNGTAGKEEYDLRPDDESQKGRSALLAWQLKDYRSMNLFVRCFYYDTKATVTANIPAAIGKCSLNLTMTSKGDIVGKSTMKCE